MKEISMDRVNQTRENMLDVVKSATLTHEQKVEYGKLSRFSP